ncbi:hypothetical protein DOTSEDRAFT_73451 [Dothistroma septosporum NZE10]|uniref:AD domain-containing protein n=1 Tax=Dothistroma septosporum (strain NZE10 / CBS 128990) TaxID=675120 RepID=N1PMF2_DOTSN|nr:hypothetical protein DOTSEDRAFT_73451 [Dothistroma septosporum NZE10]
MADTKRNSVAGKVATPKSGGSPAMPPLQDPFESLGKVIGAKVKITTSAPQSQTLEGTLYTADPILNIVAINTRAPSPNGTAQPGDYHIIPSSTIRSFQIVDLAPFGTAGDSNFADAAPSIGPIDPRQLLKREETRVAQLKEQEANRGKGVSKDGQALFDALKRINMQVRWHGQQIVVNDIAIISPPYEVNDVKGSQEKQAETQRIKKIVEGEKRKLREKEDKERKAATPTGTRKGG